MKPLHYVLIGVAAVIVLVGSGFLLGRSTKHCAGDTADYQGAADGWKIAYDALKTLSEQGAADRQALQLQNDSLVEQNEILRSKPRINATYRALYSLPDDSIADRLLAAPIQP